MKQLFWKEWRELRHLPLGAALTVAVALGAAKAYTHWNHEPFSVPFAAALLVGAWLLFAVLAGAGQFSQEIGTGTLQFLSSLPVSRRAVWSVKAATALGALCLSLAVSSIVWAALCAIWSPAGLAAMMGRETLPGLIGGIGIAAFFVICCLAISLAVSPFFDRSLSASVAGILGCVVIHAAILAVVGNWSPHEERLSFTLVGLTIPTFTLISFWTFTRGESLQTNRRFLVGGKVTGACLAAWFAVVLAGRLFGVW